MLDKDPYLKLRAPSPTPEDEICKCRDSEAIKLMSALSHNPIHCIDCNLEVAPEPLALEATLVDEIARWRSVFDGIGHLWLDSGEYEGWARGQLSVISSAVNRRGREVSETLSRVRRCYYWYFQDQSTENFEPVKVCPACQRQFMMYPHGIFPQFICESCSIITVAE
jgi:predicted  nucleic acid-binding Zn ribbon protein